MRKLICILFTLLLLLNVMGYYGVFVGLKYKNEKDIILQLDAENYSDSDEITIKIPISIPYATDSRTFERVDGKFEHKGELYRLVKQKLTQDTLHVVCIKDRKDKLIDEAMSSFVKTFTDKSVNSHSKNSKITITFIKDYIPQTFALLHQSCGWESDVVKQSISSVFKTDYYPSIIHPPEQA